MIPDDELLDDLAAVGHEVDGRLTKELYDRKGDYRARTIIDRFDGWVEAKQKVGVYVGEHSPDKASKEELCEDLRTVNESVDGTLTQEAYAEHGSFSPTTMKNRFNSWAQAKEEAGIMTQTKATVDDLVDELNKGKTQKEVAEHFGYKSVSSVSRKLSDAGYTIRNKLSRQQGDGRTLSVTADDIEEAGFDPDQPLYFDKDVGDGTITLSIHTDRVADDDA